MESIDWSEKILVLYMMDTCLKMDVISDIIHNNQVYVYTYTPDIAQKKFQDPKWSKILKPIILYFTQSKE